ncbi:hypothetical protein HELRODRAFT_171864 [Helobdella robusta]|uniref:Uncharacterized protein n=1 Tax=Helobdella robusta TaxID=6412 RepID=T1F4S4_HELRO|nr:hypothetical protein HELRODRAFT_171864 [Helobdella robusta]ESO04864.1 hypothetical protein HELRODRAFT_171864 [Helobdella robusta]
MSELEETSWIELLSSAVKSDQTLGMDKLKLVLQNFNIESPEFMEITSYLRQTSDDFKNLSTADKVTTLTVGVTFLNHANHSVINSFEGCLLDFQKHSLLSLSTDNAQLRNISGSYLGALCEKLGCRVYADMKFSIIELFHEMNNDNSINNSTSDIHATNVPNTESSTNNTHSLSPIHVDETSAQIFRDTVSWKCLDTWISCIQKIATGCGASFAQFVDSDLLSCISCSLNNRERFVRESSCTLLKTFIIQCQIYQYWQQQLQSKENQEITNGTKDKFIDLILKGMSDHWADVRLPACVSAREFILSTRSNDEDDFDEGTLNKFLPALCFNRYSIAIGLQRYSQATWMTITKGLGKKKIEENIGRVLEFYKMQLISGSSECKEMSCQCFNECIKKLDPSYIKPAVGDILSTMKLSGIFRDSVWSARDAACLLALQIIESYNEETSEFVQYLMEEMFVLTEDLAPTVRDSSASVLAALIRNNEDGLPRMIERIQTGLKNIKLIYKDHANKSKGREEEQEELKSELKQQDNTQNQVENLPMTNVEKRVNEFFPSPASPQPQEADNNSNTRPKITFVTLPTGLSTICYSRRSVEPWEVADGCICLLRKLSTNISPSAKTQLTALVPVLADSANVKNYDQRPFYVQTLLKQLPEIYEGLGKICLKRSLELFFDVIIEYYIDTDSSFAPTHHAAVECLEKLGQQLGKSILRERLASYDPLFVEKFVKF